MKIITKGLLSQSYFLRVSVLILLMSMEGRAQLMTSAFFKPRVKLTGGPGTMDVAIADLDGDGKKDLTIMANGAVEENLTVDATLSFHRNISTSGSLTTASFASKITQIYCSNNNCGDIYAFAVGDLDGDSKPDIAIVRQPGEIEIYRNQSTVGTIQFAPKFSITTGGASTTTIALSDLDKDGKADIVCSSEGYITIFRNKSTSGTLTTASFAGAFTIGESAGWSALAIGDLNGDSKPELVITDYGSSVGTKATIYPNLSTPGSLSTGSFGSKVELTTGDGPYDVTIGDLDGDNKPDIAVANSGAKTVTLLRNNIVGQSITAGSFSKVDLPALTSGRPNSIIVDDINGDGKNEVLLINSFETRISIYENKTSGTITAAAFSNRIDLPTDDGAGLSNGAIADIDGDGRKDIVALSWVDVAAYVIRYNYDTTPPAIPTGLTVTPSDGQISLSWTANTEPDLDEYKIYGGTTTNPTTVIATVKAPAATYAHTGLVNGTTYYYRVTAIDNVYNESTKSNEVSTSAKKNQTITFSSLLTKTYGDPGFGLTATTTSGLAIAYTSSNTAVATISGSTLTITGAGTATITASQPGNNSFFAATSVPQTLSVNKKDQTISFNTPPTKTYGDSPFPAYIGASSGLPITLVSSNPNVATIVAGDIVSGSTITIKGAGTTTITASQPGNSNYNPAASVPRVLTVNKKDQTVTFNALPDKSFGDAVFNLSSSASTNLPVTFTSSNTSVIVISGNSATIVGAGSSVITATQSGNSNYLEASTTQTQVITKGQQTISFPMPTPKRKGDPASQLNATASSGLAVSFASSNATVATISGNTITIIAVGTTNITASQAGNVNYLGASPVTRTLTVYDNKTQSITFDPITVVSLDEKTKTLHATASTGLPITYSTTDLSKGTISGNVLTLLQAGSINVTATQEGDQTYAPVSASQTFCINPAKPIITVSDLSSGTPTLTSSSTQGNQWFKDGAKINGAVNSTFTAIDPGIYSVMVTIEGCSSPISESQVLIVTGTETEINGSVVLYPNPLNNDLWLDLTALQNKEHPIISVYDVTGSIVKQVAQTGLVHLDFQQVQAGIYLIEVKTEKSKIVHRIVKK